MALSFPASPNVGDQYEAEGGTWTWDGTVWASGGAVTREFIPMPSTQQGYLSADGAGNIIYDDLSDFVKVSGSKMTGHLEVPSGAKNAQVPQATEVVKRAGDLMTGTLRFTNLGTALFLEDQTRIEFGTADSIRWVSRNFFEGFDNNNMAFRLGVGNTPTQIPSVYNVTSAGASNISVASSGAMRRSTSTGIYKEVLEPLSDSEATITALNPVRFRSLHEEDSDKPYMGFIAEEVATAFPEAMADDGENYDVRAIVAALTLVVQRVLERIEALEATNLKGAN